MHNCVFVAMFSVAWAVSVGLHHILLSNLHAFRASVARSQGESCIYACVYAYRCICVRVT